MPENTTPGDLTTPSSKDTLYRRVQNDFTFHAADIPYRQAQHSMIRNAALETARSLVSICPEGRELSLALTKLEEAMFWANAAIARQ